MKMSDRLINKSRFPVKPALKTDNTASPREREKLLEELNSLPAISTEKYPTEILRDLRGQKLNMESN